MSDSVSERVRMWGNNDGNIAAQKEKLSCLVAFLFLIKCVHAMCGCVCVCKCNHSDFLFPIMALIHQLAVAMVFLSPPNQRQAREHAQRGQSRNNFSDTIWYDGQKDEGSVD